MDKVDALKLPAGYHVSLGGEAEAIATVFGGLGPIILIALFGIFAVLVAEFGRFRETVVVAGVIPLGTFGGFVALFVTGGSLSYMAIIGFVALVGIEIKNSILLVDFTTQLRREGMGLRAAIERAGEVRFLPVLLTSVTAIGGLAAARAVRRIAVRAAGQRDHRRADLIHPAVAHRHAGDVPADRARG